MNKRKKPNQENFFSNNNNSLTGNHEAISGPPEILPLEIEKTGILGDGSFGTVYKGKCRSQEVAVKVLHRQDLDEHSLSAFRKEVEIVSKIFHPNILLYLGACTIPGNMMIVTELMHKGL